MHLTTICLLALGGFLTTHAQIQFSIQRNTQGAQITWTDGFLQSAATPNGPWSMVATASSPFQITKPSATTFYRIQRGYLLTVSKSGTGAGAIRSTTAGIDCGADCSELIPSGQSITLQTFPVAGSVFAGWTGDGSGAADRQVVMDGPKTVAATFNPASAGIVNGNFDQGPASGWQQFPDTVIVTGASLGITPYSGQYVARLGYQTDNRRLVQIGQTITLPNTTPLYINFAAWIYSEELCDVPYYDSMNIYAANQRVVHWDLCSNNGSNTGGWVKAYIDVTGAAGQTIGLVFEISSADNLASILLLDDIAVSSTHW